MDRFILSNFGVKVFLEEYTNEESVPSTGSSEVNGITDISGVNSMTKESKSYKTLDGDGFDSVVLLGQTYDDITLELVREGTGDTYTGAVGTTDYTKLKNWVDTAIGAGVSGTPKELVYVKPRGNNTYEGVVYNVLPLSFKDGNANTGDGQTFSVSMKVFGKAKPVVVTVSEQGAFSFALPSA